MSDKHKTQVQRAAAHLGVLGALLTLGLLAACNTTEGLGQDMQSAGEAVSDTARDAKD